MWNMINDICGINRITPRWGFRLRGDSFRRALPYANDLWAFSPMFDEKLTFREILRIIAFPSANKAESLIVNSVEKRPTKLIANSFTWLNIRRISKAESLTINSVGQRPTDIIINSVGRFSTKRIVNSFTRLNIRRKSKAESLTINSVGQRPTDIIINSVGRFPTKRIVNNFTRLNIRRNSKAESLTINSVGQRPTKRIELQKKALKGRNQHYETLK